ncbi:MAG TPA: xanthine dehydrogenase family protein molybdopterin-binding subunit, partial [Terriglobales bacterium]
VQQEASKTAQGQENAKPKRAQMVTVGIPGAADPDSQPKEIQREVPVDEPGALPPNAQLSVIGKRTSRIDGKLKVTGQAKYTADVQLPGMLYAGLVTSSEPHARILSIDTSAAESYPGVKAVHVVSHVLGVAELKDKSKETPSKYPTVRFAGQPLAAVAATTQAIADEAAKLVKVQYDPMSFVVDLDAARQPNAALVYPGVAASGGTAGGGGGAANVPQNGNVRGPALGPGGKGKGDVQAGFQQAEVTVEGEFRTQVQTHCALETHGVVADWKPEMLTVYASTQGTSSVRDELAEIFELPQSKVRVITEYMGGGFGAKFGAGNPGAIACSLSRKANAPVRLMLDRKNEHLSTGNRPNSVQQLKIGAKQDGTLTAIHQVSYGTGGVGTGAGTGGPAENMYVCPNVLTEENDVFTNAGPAAAFRAPGHPQGCFALEQAIDELAEKLNMDPLQLRDKIDEHPARREERRIGAEKVDWSQRRKPGADPGPVKRGLGAAQSVWYRINNLNSACEVRIGRDGSVELLSAVQDIGGGIRTVLAQIVAEELGLRAQDIHIRIGDTNSPVGPPSGGSMTTGSITPAARNAVFQAKQQMLEQIAPALGGKAEDIVFRDGKVFLKDNPGKSFSFKQAAARMKIDEVAARASRNADYQKGRVTYGGVHFAQVAVDTETGIVKVERVTAVHDCGRPMNPLALESQINGGVIQGVSYALYENRILDRNAGLMVNPNLEQYKIAGSQDTPQIEIELLQDYLGLTSTDAGGIGEPSTIPTAAAIANAFYNATGVRIRQLPMTPANVLAALHGSEKTQGARA